jgi:hypothetical protein
VNCRIFYHVFLVTELCAIFGSCDLWLMHLFFVMLLRLLCSASAAGQDLGFVTVNNRPAVNGTRVVILQMPFRGVHAGERIYAPILANSVYATASWQLQVDADAGLTISSITVDSSRWTLQAGVQNGGRRIVANAILAQEYPGIPQVRVGLEELGQVVLTVGASASGSLGLRCSVLFLASETERNVVQPGTAALFTDRDNRGGGNATDSLPVVGYVHVVAESIAGLHVGFVRGVFVTEMVNVAVFTGVRQSSDVFALVVRVPRPSHFVLRGVQYYCKMFSPLSLKQYQRSLKSAWRHQPSCSDLSELFSITGAHRRRCLGRASRVARMRVRNGRCSARGTGLLECLCQRIRDSGCSQRRHSLLD